MRLLRAEVKGEVRRALVQFQMHQYRTESYEPISFSSLISEKYAENPRSRKARDLGHPAAEGLCGYCRALLGCPDEGVRAYVCVN